MQKFKDNMVKFMLGIGLLSLSACAAIKLQPLPENHPGDPGLKPALIQPSATLDKSDPVDPAGARSLQWEERFHEHHENHGNGFDDSPRPENDHPHDNGLEHPENKHHEHHQGHDH